MKTRTNDGLPRFLWHTGICRLFILLLIGIALISCTEGSESQNDEGNQKDVRTKLDETLQKLDKRQMEALSLLLATYDTAKVKKRKLNLSEARKYHDNYINAQSRHVSHTQSINGDTTHAIYFRLDSLFHTMLMLYEIDEVDTKPDAQPSGIDTMGVFVYLIKYSDRMQTLTQGPVDSSQTSIAFHFAWHLQTKPDIVEVIDREIYNFGQLCPPACATNGQIEIDPTTGQNICPANVHGW